MKISVDGGALCGSSRNQYGTYIVTQNILRTLANDTENTYTTYLYKRLGTVVTRFHPITYRILRPSLGWMAVRVSIDQMVHPSDLYLGLNQAIPWYTPAKVITVLHGLSFFFHRDLYPHSFEALKDQVLFAISRSDTVFVPSERVKQELSEQFGYDRAIVNHFGIPYDMANGTRKKKRPTKPYFLFVGMDHPIKNISFLVDAFTVLKSDPRMKDAELVLVGEHEQWSSAKRCIRTVRATRAELAELYRNASAYLSASLYESCNLPILEAIGNGTPVIAKTGAVIHELRDSVTVADKLEEFVEAMKHTVLSSRNTSQHPIGSSFSWDHFCERLKEAY